MLHIGNQRYLNLIVLLSVLSLIGSTAVCAAMPSSISIRTVGEHNQITCAEVTIADTTQ